MKEYFNFSGATFLKSNLHKDPEDPNKTAVTVEINTKNIFKIMEARVFKDIKIAYLKSDTGMIFSWYIPNDYIVSNSIDTYNFFVTSDIEIKSTNGLMNDNKINWFIFGNKPDPRGYYYVTTVKSDGKFVLILFLLIINFSYLLSDFNLVISQERKRLSRRAPKPPPSA
ncbi:MAG: hypothetical protein IPL16_10630 [Ignavibacteria bacterium]|nr:hypothetical protein [Ignavibacteria bacterium]